jgi:Mrp family chromosome partitioning ATPase
MSDCNHQCDSCSQDCKDRIELEKPHKMSSVKKIIGIVSGKGGVGKSLITALFAVLMHQKGYQTAIMDVDITGPSIPKMFGITEKIRGSQEGLLPSPSAGGIKIMSSNLLLKNDTDPVVWRGPILAGLVKQFWKDVIWQDIDFLFLDMPPGTGDVPLTVFQSIPVDGIVIVTSPQELVGMIVSKALKMAQMMHIPVLGLVENMSYYECDECHKQVKIFGESHVDEIAARYGVKVLAKLPLQPNVASLCDKGRIEDARMDYLDQAIQHLEELPLSVTRIGLPIKKDQISAIGDAAEMVVFDCAKRMVLKEEVVSMNQMSEEEWLNVIKELGVNVFLTNEQSSNFQEQLIKENIIFEMTEEANPLTAALTFIRKDVFTK